ncbi:AAA family ATPase [Maribacter sp. TH_r10]|uniref:AAA family ATPase n=1 Tax=Maribacter sp. TH_r10 TaxID=3082086 RepID=UPI002954C5C0|nr:AAA family ATPase [Maribacter sp. TH_r10]MDV7138743.1 AAA family ATPase [Maribacter sp. TH_r10]
MIVKLQIKGFKSIRDITIELRPLNILIGSNGVGKSNFISFFKLLHNIYEQRLENFSLQQGANNLLYFGKKETELIYGKLFFKDSPDSTNSNSYYFTAKPTENDTLFIEKEGSGYLANWDDDTNNYFYNRDQKESHVKDSNSFRDIYLRYYFESFKIYHFHDTSSSAPLRSSCPIDDNVALKENGSNLPAFLYYLQERHLNNFKRIEKTIRSIAPFFEKFELKPDRLNPDRIKLEWIEINQPDSYFNATHFSDGTIRFIALATLLMQPNLPKTILIDEPELGLHPVAIKKLAGIIRKTSAKTQVIISTQSVTLVDNFNPEDIVTVDREENQSVFSRLDENNLTNWLEDYSLGDLWNKNVIKGQP